jgi:hypothetical protein
MLVTEKSENVLFVSEILRELTQGTADKVLADFVSGIGRFFEADINTAVLDESKPDFALI